MHRGLAFTQSRTHGMHTAALAALDGDISRVMRACNSARAGSTSKGNVAHRAAQGSMWRLECMSRGLTSHYTIAINFLRGKFIARADRYGFDTVSSTSTGTA